MLESIGPIWDGNEVWLLVAGGATFAAFPQWYATMFSGFYLALLLILVLLIVRVISFEWRGKAESPRWRAVWTWLNTIASVGAPLIWGIALSSLLEGVPLSSDHGFVGDFGDLFTWYTVFAGIAVVLLFALHGATFLTLRMTGDLRERSRTYGGAAGAGRRSPRRRIPRLDARRRERPQRQGRVPGRHRRRPRRRRRGRRGALHASPAGRAGLRGHGRDDRPRRDHALRLALSAGDGLGPELREQPDDPERRLGELHAEGDDGRRRQSCCRSSCSTRGGRTTCSACGSGTGRERCAG